MNAQNYNGSAPSHYFMRQLFYVFLIAVLSGCAACRQKVQPGMHQKHIVTEDVFLMQVDEGLHGLRLALVPESSPERGSGYYSSPPSIEKYRLNKEGKNVIGIVEKGTEIETVQIRRKKSWSFWYGETTEDTVIYGKIVSGSFARKLVDLNDVLHWPKKRIVSVNKK